MPKGRWRRFAAPTVLAAAATLVVAASATAATTYRVSGEQTVVDETAGQYVMRGSLVGDWTITSYTEIATSPIYHARAPSCSPAAWTSGSTVGARAIRPARCASASTTGPSSTRRAALSGGRARTRSPVGPERSPAPRACSRWSTAPTEQGVSDAYIGNVTLRRAKASHARTRAELARASAAPGVLIGNVPVGATAAPTRTPGCR